MELDERKKKILHAIIQNYMETGEPVGSRTISKYSQFFSSSRSCPPCLHRAKGTAPSAVNLRLCRAKPGARCYVHCTRKPVRRQPLAALHKVF